MAKEFQANFENPIWLNSQKYFLGEKVFWKYIEHRKILITQIPVYFSYFYKNILLCNINFSTRSLDNSQSPAKSFESSPTSLWWCNGKCVTTSYVDDITYFFTVHKKHYYYVFRECLLLTTAIFD